MGINSFSLRQCDFKHQERWTVNILIKIKIKYFTTVVLTKMRQTKKNVLVAQ